MPFYRTFDVFTPSIPADLSFVERGGIEVQLGNAVATPGKQIVIFGHSGCGKTTLMKNALSRLKLSAVTSRCTQQSTFENLILSAFDKLDPFYTSESSRNRESKNIAKLESNYKFIRASVERALTLAEAEKSTRVLAPQLTAERLAEFCGAARCCWVLEDFHKVPAAEKVKLAQSMKVFMDTASEYEEVKVIAIGAVGTAREVVEYDPEMRNRVAEISVPLLSEEELTKILIKGETLLNLTFGSLKHEIANYSSGLGSVCHQLALNICLGAGIHQTSPKELRIEKKQLQDALEQFVKDTTDSLKASFDKAIRRRNHEKRDHTNLILQCLTSAGSEGATHDELLACVHKTNAEYRAVDLQNYLFELEQAERGEIVRHDSASGRYSFKDPLYFVYAQCLFVPVKGSRILAMQLLGETIEMDLDDIEKIRRAILERGKLPNW